MGPYWRANCYSVENMKSACLYLLIAAGCALPRVAFGSSIQPVQVSDTFVFTPTGYCDDGVWQTYTTPSYFTLTGAAAGDDLSDTGTITAWEINDPDVSYSSGGDGLTNSGGTAAWTNSPSPSLQSLDITFTDVLAFYYPFFLVYQSDEISMQGAGPNAQLDFGTYVEGLGFDDPILQGTISYAPNGIPASVPDTTGTALTLIAGLGALALARRRSRA